MDATTSFEKGDSESKKEEHFTTFSKTDEKTVEVKEPRINTSDEKNGSKTEDEDAPDLQTEGTLDSHLVTEDQEKDKMKLELAEDYPDAENEHDAHGDEFEDSPLSKSVDFMFETRYVMLNFMSLIPPEIYRGHISTSPDTEPDLSHGFAKRHSNLSKSKSFDISTYSRKPHLKHIGKLKSMQKRMNSPASEDNLNYRYKKNLKPLDSPSCERFNSDPGTPPAVSELFEKSHSAHEFSSHSSPSSSPQKNFHSPQRLFSDASSSGELSYMSDADDEYEDHSNASSIFSARSISSRDGFLDLRRPFRGVHILPTLESQSEYQDEADGLFPQLNDNTENGAEGGNLETLPEEIKDDSAFEIERDKESMEDGPQGIADTDGKSRLKQTADRSKLKLNIPCESVQLDDILLSLHSQLSCEMDEMESEFEEALQSARSGMSRSSNITPLTPQSEAARVLARIGDEVKEQYGARLAAAVSHLTYEQINSLSYSQFRDIAQSVVTAEVPGWRQVALLMVFGQKIIWGTVQHSQRHVGNVIDYCAQFIAENAADFIIKQGGWGSVMNFDPSSDAHSSAEFDTSPEMVVDYFTSHDVTQVESEKCIDNEPGEAANIHTGFKDDQTEIGVSSQIFEDEPRMRSGQELTVPHQDKPRYASSVGFEYTDVIEDMTGVEIRSDSETDVNIGFVETDVAETNVKGMENKNVEEDGDEAFEAEGEPLNGLGNGYVAEGNEDNNMLEGHGKEEIVEETIDGKIPIDNNDIVSTSNLISEKLTDDKNSEGYDRDAVYVRQDTPSATMFDDVVGDLNVDKDINGNKAGKEEKNGIHSENRHNEKQDISGKGSDIIGKTNVNVETVAEDDNIVIVENKSKGILHLKIGTDDIESFNDNPSRDMSVGGLYNKGQDTESEKFSSSKISGTKTQTDTEGDELVMKGNDLRNYDKSNKNNNRQESERDFYVEDTSPNIYQDLEYDSDNESTENESFEREVIDECQSYENEEIDESEIFEMEIVQESDAHETMKRIGFRVAVLAFTLLALGVSVRFATQSR